MIAQVSNCQPNIASCVTATPSTTCQPNGAGCVTTMPTLTLYTAWATVKNLRGGKARTVTIEVREGVLCAMVPGPVEGNPWDGSSRVFTLTCIRPDEEKEAK